MKKKTAAYPAFHAGVSLLLVIFIILCLVVLAALSLSSALRDHSYAQKEAQKVTNFYKADTSAVHVLRSIDEHFSSLCEEGYTDRDKMIERLSEIDYPEHTVVTFSESAHSPLWIQADYTIPINEQQSLSVCLLLDLSHNLENGNYEIVSWQESLSDAWNGNDSLPVLQSTDEQHGS